MGERKIPAPSAQDKLVLIAFKQGHESVREMATALGKSERTIKEYRANLLRKLGEDVNSMSQAVNKAGRLGWISRI